VLTASIVIVTMNRREDLRRTLGVIGALAPPPLEVLVCLNGSDDGSAEMIEADFPNVTLTRETTNIGSVPARDDLFARAKGDLIISLDDDSYPLDSGFLAHLSTLADQHPEAGAFTFVEMRNNGLPANSQLGPQSPGRWVCAYPNCAGAIRREVYGDVARFPRQFFHMYEETDFAVQLYGAGWAVWFEPTIQIRHHYSPVNRSERGRAAQNARNEFWSVMLRCPFPHVLWVAPYRLIRQLAHSVSMGWSWVASEPGWWAEALKGAPAILRARRPGTWSSYWSWVRLARLTLSDRNELFARFPTIRTRVENRDEPSLPAGTAR
jgi:GT2 family glycosyltransferase